MPLWICDASEKAIWETGLDGSGPTQLMSGLTSYPSFLIYEATLNKFFYMLSDIRVVDYDGSNDTQIINPATSGGIDADFVNQKLYYTESNAHQIRKVDYDGNNDTLCFNISSSHKVGRLQVDIAGGKVYWSGRTAGVNAEILRADLNGSNEEVIAADGTHEVCEQLDLDLVNGKVYWSNSTANIVRRCDFDGSNQETIVTSAVNVWGCAVDGTNGKVYYTEGTPKNVKRANLDGTSQEVIWEGSTFPAYLYLSSGAGAAGRKTRWGPWVYLLGPGRSFGQGHHTYP